MKTYLASHIDYCTQVYLTTLSSCMFSHVKLFTTGTFHELKPTWTVHGIFQTRILEWVAILYLKQPCKIGSNIVPFYR